MKWLVSEVRNIDFMTDSIYEYEIGLVTDEQFNMDRDIVPILDHRRGKLRFVLENTHSNQLKFANYEQLLS